MFQRAIKWFFAGGGRLKERVVRGGVWLLIGASATRLATVVKLAVLARLLSPNDFGLMGVAMLVFTWVGYFTEIGLGPSLIQKKGDIGPYLDSAWTSQILRSCGIATILVAGAPLGARFFGNAQAVGIIRALALITLCWGFTNPAVVHLRRDLDFAREVTWRLSGVLVGLLTALPLAYVFRNVWALVISAVAAQATETAASYWIVRYRPSFRLDWKRVRELMKFGRWMFAMNMAAFAELYGDSLVVGRLLGTTALGYYQMASQLALLATSQIAGHIEAVMFPAFARLDRAADLRRAFVLVLGFVSAVVLPVGCFVSVFSAPLVGALLGPQWRSIAPLLQILAWGGVAVGIGATTRPLLMGIGRPVVAVKASVVRIATMAALIYPLMTKYGMQGAALAAAAGAIGGTTYQLWAISRILQASVRDLAAPTRTSAAVSLSVVGVGLLVGRYSVLPMLLVGVALSVYLLAQLLRLKVHVTDQATVGGDRLEMADSAAGTLV